MEENELKEKALTYYSALNKKDVELITSLFRTDGSVDYPTAMENVSGTQSIKAFFSEAAQNVPRLKVDVQSMFACKDRVAVHWFSNGISDVTNTIDEHFGIDIFNFEEGAIKNLTVTYSIEEMN